MGAGALEPIRSNASHSPGPSLGRPIEPDAGSSPTSTVGPVIFYHSIMSDDLTLGQLLDRAISTAFKVSAAPSANEPAVQASTTPFCCTVSPRES